MDSSKPDPSNQSFPKKSKDVKKMRMPVAPPGVGIPLRSSKKMKIAPTELSPTARPKIDVNAYRPPAQLESEPIYVDRRMFFGFIGAVVLLVLGVAVWKIWSTPAAVNTVATMTLVNGKNVKRHLSEHDWVSLSLPATIEPGDFLMTGNDRRNVLVSKDGSTVRIDYGTSLKIDSINETENKTNIKLTLYQGNIFITESATADIAVETKYSKISPVGTRYGVEQVENKDLTERTIISVVEGTVEAKHVDDDNARVLIKAGEQASVASQAVTQAKNTAPSKWVAWNSDWILIADLPQKGPTSSASEPMRVLNPEIQAQAEANHTAPQPIAGPASAPDRPYPNDNKPRQPNRPEQPRNHPNENVNEDRRQRELADQRSRDEQARLETERREVERQEAEKRKAEQYNAQRRANEEKKLQETRNKNQDHHYGEAEGEDKNRAYKDYDVDPRLAKKEEEAQRRRNAKLPPPPPPGLDSHGGIDYNPNPNATVNVDVNGYPSLPVGNSDDMNASVGDGSQMGL